METTIMLTRRAFLGASAAATAALASTTEARAQQNAGRQHPAIQALGSMRGQARPITADERRARIDKARRLMAEHKIDALTESDFFLAAKADREFRAAKR